VELDGEIHLQQIKYDKERTGILNELGIDVIRFSNSETLKDIDGIIVQIESKVKSRLENNLYP
jgi:very-short-patch-repair endonuclease